MNTKDRFETLMETNPSRRRFLTFSGKVMAFLSALPLLKITGNKANAAPASPKASKTAISLKGGKYTLLKNGLVVDGTGKKGFKGSLLIHDRKIETISTNEINVAGQVIDCSGLVIMPGIIDAHSHMDWYLPIKGHEELKLPFTAQGVTTFVAGQCGYGVAGFRKNSPFMSKITPRTKGLIPNRVGFHDPVLRSPEEKQNDPQYDGPVRTRHHPNLHPRIQCRSFKPGRDERDALASGTGHG